MSAKPPQPDDPLAALANAAAKAVRRDDLERAEKLAEQQAGTASKRRLVRTVSIVVIVAVLVCALAYQGPRMLDPYYGDDPLEDPQRAKAYVAGLLDDLAAYRARNGGTLPRTLEIAVSDSRLPPRGSQYRLEYRVEAGVPVVTLQGGPAPITMRGAGK